MKEEKEKRKENLGLSKTSYTHDKLKVVVKH